MLNMELSLCDNIEESNVALCLKKDPKSKMSLLLYSRFSLIYKLNVTLK